MSTPITPQSRDPFATLVSLMGSALSSPIAAPAAQPTPQRRSWIGRLEAWSWRARQRDLERELEGAADVADLERRLRARERRTLHAYY